MIQRYLADELKKILPDLEWTANFYTGDDHTGTVYSEGGSPSDLNNETGMRYPSCMVYIRSSGWSFAETAAQKVYDFLQKKSDFVVEVEQFDKYENVIGSKTFHVFLISATEPIRIGVKNGIMDYSVNFDVSLMEIREE